VRPVLRMRMPLKIILVRTTEVNSVFRSLWLATQTRDSICYSPPGIFLISHMSFPLLLRKKGTIWCWLSTGLVYTKTIIHLGVGEKWSRLGKYPLLFTSTPVNYSSPSEAGVDSREFLSNLRRLATVFLTLERISWNQNLA